MYAERDERSHWSLQEQFYPSSCGLTPDTAPPLIDRATCVYMRRDVSH
jgi:hypothetical protein